MTVTSHALVLFSATGVYMLAFSVITWAAVHKFEYLGYVFFAIGVLLMLTDPFAVKADGSGNQYLGDIIAFLSAASGAILGVYNSNNAKIIHPIILLGQVLFVSMIYQSIFWWFMVGPSNALSFDQEYGILGWISNTNLFLFMLLIVAPFTWVINNIWFYAAYHYWPMEIIAGTILMLPFLSQAVGVLLGQDMIPGFRTILGLVIITMGTLVTSYGTKLRAIETVHKYWKDEQITTKIQLSTFSKAKKDSSLKLDGFSSDSEAK